MKLESTSVARRAGLVFAVMFTLTITVAATVFALIRAAGADLTHYQQRSGALALQAERLRSDFYNYDDQMNMYVAVLAGDRNQQQLAETTYQEAAHARRALGADLVAAGRVAEDATTRDLLTRLRRDVEAYDGFAAQTRTAAQAGDIPRAVYLTTVGNLQPSNDIMPTLDKITKHVQAHARSDMRRSREHQAQVEVVSVVFGLLVVALLAVLRTGLRRLVLRPLASLRTTMTDVATGRAEVGRRVPVARHDEFGELATAFNAMLDALDDREAQLLTEQRARERDGEIAFARMQTAAEDSRHRAQAVVDESAAAVVTELRALIDRVGGVRQAAVTIDQRVETANTVTRSVVDQASDAGQVVTALGGSLRRVAGMARLIADVADQTKLLALNATIEAARAGAAGKGFSVVAGEVKELAVTTEQSTTQISTTIGALESDVATMTATITRMADSVGGLDESTSVLGEVAAAQHGVVDELTTSLSEAIARIESMTDLTRRLERRRHPRVSMYAEVSVADRYNRYQGNLLDLSEGGMRCELTGPAPQADETLAVEFTLDDEAFSLRARVVRCLPVDGATHVAVQFVDMAPHMHTRLRNHLPLT